MKKNDKKVNKPDNIKLFNELTHDDTGAVDEIVFDRLIEDFKFFVLFKKICGNNHSTKCRNEKKHIKFRMEFKTSEIANNFIKCNDDTDIKYKHNHYKPICTKISQQIIDVYFIKN